MFNSGSRLNHCSQLEDVGESVGRLAPACASLVAPVVRVRSGCSWDGLSCGVTLIYWLPLLRCNLARGHDSPPWKMVLSVHLQINVQERFQLTRFILTISTKLDVYDKLGHLVRLANFLQSKFGQGINFLQQEQEYPLVRICNWTLWTGSSFGLASWQASSLEWRHGAVEDNLQSPH